MNFVAEVDDEHKKKHVDEYYNKVEDIMRKNNAGFFNAEILAGRPSNIDESNEYKSNQPIFNETNYNVHLKNENGIVNIFIPKQPKSQGQNQNRQRSTNFNFNKGGQTSITLNGPKSHIYSNQSFESSAYFNNKPLTGINTYYKEMLRKPGKFVI